MCIFCVLTSRVRSLLHNIVVCMTIGHILISAEKHNFCFSNKQYIMIVLSSALYLDARASRSIFPRDCYVKNVGYPVTNENRDSRNNLHKITSDQDSDWSSSKLSTDATSKPRSDVTFKPGIGPGIISASPDFNVLKASSKNDPSRCLVPNRCTSPCLQPRKSMSAKLERLPFLVFTPIRVFSFQFRSSTEY